MSSEDISSLMKLNCNTDKGSRHRMSVWYRRGGGRRRSRRSRGAPPLFVKAVLILGHSS